MWDQTWCECTKAEVCSESVTYNEGISESASEYTDFYKVF